jgi:hypothetical protein
MCCDEREMGGWVYKGQYAEDCLLHITQFAYQMCKSAETLCHSMVSCVECIVELYICNKTLFDTTAKSPENPMLDPTICMWICPVLESRNIVAILFGGNLMKPTIKVCWQRDFSLLLLLLCSWVVDKPI